MNKVQLKEYIKKAILEGEYLEDDPEAMDAMDDAMVADYEEEEANKFALDSEEPLEEATNNIPDDIQWSVSEVVGRVDDYAVEVNLEGYSPTTDKEYTAYTTAVEIGDGYEWDEVYDVEEVPMEEIVKRANSIVEAWNYEKKNNLTEAFNQMEAMYQDLDQVVKNIAHIGEVGKEEAAMLAIEYIAEQYQVSVEFKDFM